MVNFDQNIFFGEKYDFQWRGILPPPLGISDSKKGLGMEGLNIITQIPSWAQNDRNYDTFPTSLQCMLWDQYFWYNHQKSVFRQSYVWISLSDTSLAYGVWLQTIITERVYKIET